MKWQRLVGILGLLWGVSGNTPCPASPPNIVFFLVDDLGATDLGSYGSTFYETPNLDALARQGVRFTQAYAACPVCSPTRASIFTGLWPQRTGVTDYLGAPPPEKWSRNTPLLPAPFSDRLALDHGTIAEGLKSVGYQTFFAGKWHLGPEGWWPENQGFDINRGGIDRGGPYGGNKYFSPYGNPRLEDGPPGEHLPERLAMETAAFIRQHRNSPFFAVLSFYSVHTPLMARADLLEKYRAKLREMPIPDAWGHDGFRDVRLAQNHPVYAAMVEAMDQAVGTVLEALQDEGLDKNTMVIFTSDNGGLSTSEGWPTSNAPLRTGKGWLYEGGIRVPLIVRWPGAISPASTCDIPVSSPDCFPTLAEAASLPASVIASSDGQSMIPMFTGQPTADRPLFWHYPHYGNQGGAPGSAIRLGKWKLIRWHEDQRCELFDLDNDPSEQTDVANEHPARVSQMQERLANWLVQVGAQFPSANPAYDPAAASGRTAVRPRSSIDPSRKDQ